MKRTLNHLVQLQDLCLARAEQEALLPEARLTELDSAIKALKEELPKPISRRFERLMKHYNSAIVPVFQDACTGCGSVLPTSLNQQVLASNELIYCPACSRMLYWYKGPRTADKDSDDIRKTVGIARFSNEDLMLAELKAETKEEAIEELVHLMTTQEYIDRPESVLEVSLRREAMITTGVGNCLAFPHARGIECCGLTLAVGMKKEGIDWGAPDGSPARFIFFVVIPTAASAFYLDLISGLMKTFRHGDACEKLLECQTNEEMWDMITDLTKDSIH